ncbi:unnamed protein product [Gordionus sp. m RMFG-2023]|uniref:phosducin-like protein 3 isoform X2 n=1 Tax=Gordionus sp. m RMFG-2023 TaxID=3053472 RepID=UPI0030E3B770
MDQYAPGKTEWEDALIKKNIIEPKKLFTEKEITNIIEDVANNYNSNNDFHDGQQGSSSEELDEDNDEYFQKYKQKKAQDIMMNKNQLFSQVLEITGEDFKGQVSAANPNLYVLVHLYQNSILPCQLINRSMEELSKLHTFNSRFKFVKIISTRCIPNFPDSNLPQVFELIWRKY